jgi:uncharacterized Zn finger protein
MFGRGYGYGFRPYVPVAARRRAAAMKAKKLSKAGVKLTPVVAEGRSMTRTFWGASWCANLERYSDFANRLPRGRTYVRNGSVMHLAVGVGRVDAMVSGSDIYNVSVQFEPLPKTRWASIRRDCAGAIESLIDLLQGRLSDGVMARVCKEGAGLFPSPKEIHMTCSCPDYATLCKHVAAVLYGVGIRLDEAPDLLFALRNVDPKDLVAGVVDRMVKPPTESGGEPTLEGADLADVFGIDLDPASSKPSAAAPSRKSKKNKSRASGGGTGKKTTRGRSAESAPKKQPEKSPAKSRKHARAKAAKPRSARSRGTSRRNQP